jgi:hypothetical protein
MGSGVGRMGGGVGGIGVGVGGMGSGVGGMVDGVGGMVGGLDTHLAWDVFLSHRTHPPTSLHSVVHLHTHTRECENTHTTRMHTHTHAHAHARVHTHTPTHTHTHPHTHTHTLFFFTHSLLNQRPAGWAPPASVDWRTKGAVTPVKDQVIFNPQPHNTTTTAASTTFATTTTALLHVLCLPGEHASQHRHTCCVYHPHHPHALCNARHDVACCTSNVHLSRLLNRVISPSIGVTDKYPA